MASSSISQLSSIELTNEEAELLYTSIFGWDFVKEDPKLFLLGCFISSKPIDIYVVINAFEGIWKPNNVVSISVIQDNFLKIKFKDFKSCYEVLNRGPWLYKDEWLAITEYDPAKSIGEYTFNVMRIWIRIFSLPSSLYEDFDRSHLVGHALGSMVGNVIRTDTREAEGNMKDFLRVEIFLNITKPVTRFVFIGSEENKTMCRLQYERLPTLCPGCGIISHTIENCPIRSSLDLNKLQYGEWLRYLPPRRRPVGTRGRLRYVEPELNQNNPPPNANPAPVVSGNTNIPHNEPNAMGSLNEGDVASFSEQPTEEAPNTDTAMGVVPPANDPFATDSKQKAPLEPQPLNTIYPIPKDVSDEEWDATDDGVPSPTAQKIKKTEVELPSAPAPALPNRGTKRRSPIQVSLPPKKSKPSGSTPKVGMISSKNSPAAVDSQPAEQNEAPLLELPGFRTSPGGSTSSRLCPATRP